MSGLLDQLQLSKSKLLDTLTDFINKESLSGILMFMAAITAMIIANSPLADDYYALWHAPVGIMFGEHEYRMDLLHVVNDGFMSLFFLLVGLEIKRELLLGELSDIKKAAFPVVAALGGMIVPAIIFLLINSGTPAAGGFGIPMATDIAFTLGIMLLMGSSVPFSAKIFLMTLAVVDDMGAILIIAVYYSESVNWMAMLSAALIVLGLIVMNKRGIKRLMPYLVAGIFLWYFVHESGIHATLSGVILALVIPVASKIDKMAFLHGLRGDLDHFCEKGCDIRKILLTRLQLNILETIYRSYVEVQNPLVRLQRILHNWSAFIIMPIFAFANAGVSLEGISFEYSGIMWGVVLGLVVGKPLGIYGFTYFLSRTGLVKKPDNLGWPCIIGLGLLAGVGFTMSIFIGQLAFEDAGMIAMAKVSILVASLLAGIIGASYLVRLNRATTRVG